MRIGYWIAAFAITTVLGVAVAFAQEIYRPMLVKQDKITDTGLFCLTSDELATGAKLLGIKWMAEPNMMRILGGEHEIIEVSFAADGCAVSATLVR